ncbi:hypothetical protein TNCT_518341 [Trichonephila clavata]|nr:hypothetical protein TNCT_518341 [Trichonephila clavata]
MCSYSTQGKQQFDIHCARHLRQHKYSCDYCKKGFVTKNEAIVHMRVHTVVALDFNPSAHVSLVDCQYSDGI